MNGADLIAKILKMEGLEILPAFPHSDLIDSCAKEGIRPIIVRQERQALHIADGYTRISAGQRLCCTTVQYGPGSENAAGAVAQCYADNVPILHIPGGYPAHDAQVSPNYRASDSQRTITKWCATVPDIERIPLMMQNAISVLRNGCPGPVTLEVPADLFVSEAGAEHLSAYRTAPRSAPIADTASLEQLADILLGAENPVIVAGQGILYSRACEALRDLADMMKIPVISTLNGKSCFPENHELALGCAGGSRPDVVNAYLDKADVLVGLGTSFTRSEYITPFPTRGKRIVQLTNCESDIGKDYPADLGIIGDAQASMSLLIDILSDKAGARDERRQHVIRDICEMKQRFSQAWRPLLESDEVPINPYRVIADLMKTVDRDRTVVTHDAGSPRDQMTAFFETTIPHGYIGWGKTTQLGMGLGLVQGAKLARPAWDAINVMGDAAIGMVGMDFETGVRNRIGTTTIILKNGLMGGYSKYHPNASEKYGIEVLGGDYRELAQALGGYGERVERPGDIVPSIKRALERNREGVPALLEVVTREESRIPRNLPSCL